MRRHVVGLGDILWDVLPDGKKLGDAPANFAYHCRQFGLDGIAVSAGDSFTAAMCAGMLAGLPLSEAHKAAVKVSAYVCTCNGAMPILPPQITASLRGSR